MQVKANQQLVTACCGQCLRAGVRPGMTIAHARALLRDPVVVDADPGRDRRSLEKLARWMMRFSPFVAVDRTFEDEGREPDGLLLDLTGCDRLFGGERCLLGLMSAALTGLRLHHRIGVGPNIASAWAGAHYGGEVVTVVGEAPPLRSEGAPECCHGWSKVASGDRAEPVVTGEKVGSPEGAKASSLESSAPSGLQCSAPITTGARRTGARSASARSQSRPSLHPWQHSSAPLGQREAAEADLTTFFSPLPTASLRLPANVLHALEELGLETVADVLKLPRISLPSRFGRILLTRIDQAFGRTPESFTPLTVEPPLVLEHVLEGPTTNPEAIEIVTRELLRGLAQELARRESGVTRLCLQIDRVKEDCRGVEVAEEALTLSRPSRNAKHLWTLLRPRVERLHLGNGVERVALIAKRQRRVRHRQVTRDDSMPGRGAAGSDESLSQAAGELIDALVNRLGEDRVLRAMPRNSHLPERVEAYEKIVDEDKGADRASDRGDLLAASHQSTKHRSLARSALFWSTSPRPSVLLDPPQHIEAIAVVPDRPPSRITWNGEDHLMIRGIGPERLNEEWWKVARATEMSSSRCSSETAVLPTNRRVVSRTIAPAPASTVYRDYYRIQDKAGRWLWVFKESESGRWFVHGVWA